MVALILGGVSVLVSLYDILNTGRPGLPWFSWLWFFWMVLWSLLILLVFWAVIKWWDREE